MQNAVSAQFTMFSVPWSMETIIPGHHSRAAFEGSDGTPTRVRTGERSGTSLSRSRRMFASNNFWWMHKDDQLFPVPSRRKGCKHAAMGSAIMEWGCKVVQFRRRRERVGGGKTFYDDNRKRLSDVHKKAKYRETRHEWFFIIKMRLKRGLGYLDGVGSLGWTATAVLGTSSWLVHANWCELSEE